ncbi:MAG: hypothetical protein ABI251_06120 [Mycobacteriaceae bacterium]
MGEFGVESMPSALIWPYVHSVVESVDRVEKRVMHGVGDRVRCDEGPNGLVRICCVKDVAVIRGIEFHFLTKKSPS